MYFANPLGLLALLSLPTILVIHLYHRRLPPVLVAGLHLWGGNIQQPTSGRRRERLPLTASLILELLAALLLSLVLSQPRFGELDSVTHLVVVLDSSASMSAVGRDGVSFRNRAIEELDARFKQLPRGSVVTIITTGRRPELFAGPAIRWLDAQSKLSEWLPERPKHDFATALDMAVQVAGKSGQVLFLSDHLPDEQLRLDDSIEVVAVGQPLGNVAIIAARWSHDADSLAGHVFVRLANRGERAVTTKVIGKHDTTPLFSSDVELAANAERTLEFDVKGGIGQIEVTAETPNDPLAIDNQVTLIEPKLRPIAVSNRLPKDDIAQRAVQRVLTKIADLRFVEPDAAHLIVDSASQLPPSRRDLWWFGIGPLQRTDEAQKAAKDLLGPYLIDKRHPLSDGLKFGGVVWSRVQPLSMSATPIITAGDWMLLARLNGTATTAFVLNIDVSKSNLTETPDWPILISNIVEQRRDQLPGLRRWNYRLNEEIAFRLYETKEDDAVAERPLQLKYGSHLQALSRTPMVELPSLDRTGIYSIQDGDLELGRFAVNYFDTDESTLTRLRSGRRDAVVKEVSDGYEIDSVLTWLLMSGIVLIILLSFANWRELSERKTTSVA